MWLLLDFLISLIPALLMLGICCIIVGLLVIKYTTSNPLPIIVRYDSEKMFIDPASGQTQEFPFFQEDPTVDLSVIVPSYNEEERLPIMMDETLECLQSQCHHNDGFSYEVIIVDDGSKDNTSKVALEYARKYGCEKIRVLTLHKNRGKGGAVRLGVFSSRGRNVLFVDADGATRFADIVHVEKGLNSLNGGKDGMAIAVGSRAHLQEQAVAKRSLFRNFLMYGFHFLVYFLCVKGINDTQCGFKLLTRNAALRLFSCLHVERWAFDVELLYIAQAFGVPIAEVAVNWQEIDGSKMVPVFSWLQMGRDLLLIRLRYLLGAWKLALTKPNILDLE